MALSGVVGAGIRRAKIENWLVGGALRGSVAPIDRRTNGVPAPQPGRYAETACVRHLLPDRIVAAAERRAKSIGVGAERVLVCADAITEEAYLTALAASLGTRYERLDGVSRSDCPLDDRRLIEAATAGLLPLREGRDLTWIIAPHAMRARRLADPRCERPQWLASFRLTSADRLRAFVARHAGHTLGRHATDGLRLSRPSFSNAPRTPARRIGTCVVAMTWALAFFALAPLVMIEGLAGAFCALFLAGALLRVLSLFTRSPPARHVSGGDAALPPYTIICALYHEATIVRQLVRPRNSM